MLLLNNLPPNLHLIITSRADPPLPVCGCVATSMNCGLPICGTNVMNQNKGHRV
jgi:hypothetical protein